MALPPRLRRPVPPHPRLIHLPVGCEPARPLGRAVGDDEAAPHPAGPVGLLELFPVQRQQDLAHYGRGDDQHGDGLPDRVVVVELQAQHTPLFPAGAGKEAQQGHVRPDQRHQLWLTIGVGGVILYGQPEHLLPPGGSSNG